MAVLVFNAGSTSLKLDLVDGDDSRRIASIQEAGAIEAVAHRIVHGGPRFLEPALIDGSVLDEIRDLELIAPLHNAFALRGIEEVCRSLPGTEQVAVFDTAFHRTIPDEAAVYAIPARWRDEFGIRRYGFHGLSVQWCAERVPAPRLVVCHLGGGCSVTAVRDGRSVDTTMGFTPLEGVPMATRAGSFDPGALVHLLQQRRLTVDEVNNALEHGSGLFALAGTADARRLEPGSLALGVFTHRVAGAVAAMAVAAGGLDALAFTAGIGEGSALVRAEVCRRLDFLGVRLDDDANAGAEPDCDVHAAGSLVRVAVVRAREELVAARAARDLLGLRK